MTLVNTRQKLQPFIDEGVVHTDRKIRKKKEKLPDGIVIEKKLGADLHLEIKDYK